MARAREGKDGRPPRFDPVLDEVAAKLEKEVLESMSSHASYCLPPSHGFKQVARIKLGEAVATEIGGCLKAKTASQGRAAGNVPVNFGQRPSLGVDKKVRSRTRIMV